MFVKDFMTANPVTVPVKTPVTKTLQIMKDHGLKRLPVMNGDQLVGLVTETDIMKVLPSPATTLSKHELHYLADKIVVNEAMSDDVIVVSPRDTIESAIMLMRTHDIGCVPVVEDGRLLGILTESNIFDALIELLGLRRSGVAITVHVVDRIGALAELTEIIRDLGVTIVSLATLPRSANSAAVIVRLGTEDPQMVIDALKKKGYEILHVAQPH